MRWDRPHRPEEGDRPHETEVSDARIPRTPEDGKVWVPWSELYLSPEEEARLEQTPPEDTPAERGPAPERADEPDSWRGDGGQYLNHEENLVTDHAIDHIRTAEPQITHDLRAIDADLPHAGLVGLEYRLKGEDRFKEKVAGDYAELRLDTDVHQVAEKIADGIRYTYQLDKESYVDGYVEIRDQLEERGYTMLLARNTWDNPDYKGLNTRWSTPEGQPFEVQFHTPESFQAKQVTHGYYEQLRSPVISQAKKAELEAAQREIVRRIPTPDRVAEIPDYLKEGY